METPLRTYTTLVELEAAPDRVRAALLRPETWLASWPHVRRLDLVAAGDGRGVGRRYRATVRAVAPYRLTWDMEVVRADPDVVAWAADGDLEGDARLELAPTHAGSRILSTWSARPTPGWIGMLWPVAAGLFVRNHDALMRRGAVHLADRLGVGLVRCARPAAAAPAAPAGRRGRP